MDAPTHQREEALYRLWEREGLVGRAFTDLRGARITLLSRGVRNRASGPDYLGAVLLIDGELRVGDVEMHRTEGEWFLHGHQGDPAFERVILHLLGEGTPAPRLPIPTVDAARLMASGVGADATDADGSPDGSSTADQPFSPALLAELSWSRFLRRCTAILREEPGIPSGQRVRRAFLRRLYDTLGLMENREPMRLLAERVIGAGERLRGASFEELAAFAIGASGLDPERMARAAAGALEPDRLERIMGLAAGVAEEVSAAEREEWRLSGRPGNDPARRLWGTILLTHALMIGSGLERLFEEVAADRPFERLLTPLTARLGKLTVIGRDRGREIAVNALLPSALAAGILRDDPVLTGGACRRYRVAPSLGSNRIIRLIESRYLRNDRLHGAFWQQGAIEYHQRYLAPDRTRISFIAEHPKGE